MGSKFLRTMFLGSSAFLLLFFAQVVVVSADAPTLVEAGYIDEDGNGRVDKIVLTFDQVITTCSTITLADFTFVANDITGAALTGGVGSTCSGDNEDVTLVLGTAGNAGITSHSTAPTIAYTRTTTVIQNAEELNAANFEATEIDDAAGPVVTALNVRDSSGNDGILDTVVITYSENLTNTAAGANGFDVSTDGGSHGTCNTESADPAVSTALTLTFTCTGVDTSLTGFTVAFTANEGIVDAAGNESPSKTFTSASSPAITDQAKPILVSIVKSTSSNKNTLTLTYSEPMFIDSSNQDGVVDAADTTSSELMTSVSGLGSFQSAGALAGVGTFATAGTLTQNAATNNTLDLDSSGKILTVTLNASDGYFLSSTSGGDGAFTPSTTYVFAQTPAGTPATYQQINTGSTPTVSGSWDLTPPAQITGLAYTGAANSIALSWTQIATAADFNKFMFFYRQGQSGTTYANGTLWTSSNDSALATNTTVSTTVTSLADRSTFYFIGYSMDIAGNLSTVSSELRTATASGGGGGSYVAPVTPAVPATPATPETAPSTDSSNEIESSDSAGAPEKVLTAKQLTLKKWIEKMRAKKNPPKKLETKALTKQEKLNKWLEKMRAKRTPN